MTKNKTRNPQRCALTFDEIDGLQIKIPAARSWPLALFLGLWLCFWFVGELAAIITMLAYFFGASVGPGFKNFPPGPFLMFWILGWTVAGVFVLDALVWQLRGQELIQLSEERIAVHRSGSLWRRKTRVFPLGDVRNLRFAPLVYKMFPVGFRGMREQWEAQMQWLGTSGGSVAFDVDDRTYRFGIQLSEQESRRLIKTIKDRYKIAEDTDLALPVERL